MNGWVHEVAEGAREVEHCRRKMLCAAKGNAVLVFVPPATFITNRTQRRTLRVVSVKKKRSTLDHCEASVPL